jgi:hypothetical protein
MQWYYLVTHADKDLKDHKRLPGSDEAGLLACMRSRLTHYTHRPCQVPVLTENPAKKPKGPQEECPYYGKEGKLTEGSKMVLGVYGLCWYCRLRSVLTRLFIPKLHDLTTTILINRTVSRASIYVCSCNLGVSMLSAFKFLSTLAGISYAKIKCNERGHHCTSIPIQNSTDIPHSSISHKEQTICAANNREYGKHILRCRPNSVSCLYQQL